MFSIAFLYYVASFLHDKNLFHWKIFLWKCAVTVQDLLLSNDNHYSADNFNKRIQGNKDGLMDIEAMFDKHVVSSIMQIYHHFTKYFCAECQIHVKMHRICIYLNIFKEI